MRNLKKLLAVLVSVAVMLTAVIPAFAAEAAKTPAQIAEQLGVLKGGTDGVTDAYLALGTKRIQAAIMLLRLKGLEETARAYTESTVNFKDAKDVSGDTVNLLAYLKNTASLGWQGGPSGNFTPNADATPQMLYKALLEALGYKQGTDFEYSDVLGFAKALGMGDIASKTKITNGDLATAVVEALGAKMKDSNQTLAEKMAEDNTTFATKAAELGLINTATIDAIAAVTIAYGADAAAVKKALPELVTVKYADGTSIKKAVTWATVDTSKEGDQTIQGTVDGIGAKASIKVTIAAMPLDFTLSAVSYKEVTVTFNKAVAADLLKKENFAINGSDAVNVIAAADGKSVVLEASSAIGQQGKFEVTCKKAVGFSADTKKSLEGVIDATPPSVEKVEAVSNNEIKVTFTEPVTNFLSLSNYKIDGLYFGANVPSATPGRVLTIKTTTRLVAGAHKISISDSLVDYAGWKLAAKEYDFTVATDTAAPKFVSISATQTKATIEFDEDLQAVGSYTVPAGVTVSGTKIDGKKFEISFLSTAALPVSEVTIKVKDVEDKYGNKSAEIEMKVTAQPDQVRPAFVGATTDKQASIILEFTKEVDSATAVAGTNVIVKDKDGNNVNVTVAYAKDSSSNDVKTKLEVKRTPTNDFASGNYTVTLIGITDINPLKNVILPVMTTVSIADKTSPTIASIQSSGSYKLYVTFSEEVNEATAEDKANYTYVTTGNLIKGLNGSTTVELMYDKKTVLITFPSSGDDSVNISTIASLQIASVQDTAGNVLTTVATASPFGPIGTAPVVSSAKATGEQTIVLSLDQKVVASTLTVSDFQVVAGSVYNLNIINIAYNDDNKEITLTINEKLDNWGDYVVNGVSYGVVVKTIANCNLKNAFGQALTGSDTDTIEDAYAPVVSIASAVYSAAAGTVTITVDFNEFLNIADSTSFNNTTETQFLVFVDGTARAYTATYNDVTATWKSKIVFVVSGVSGMKDKTANIKFFKAPAPTITDIATTPNDLANFDLSKTIE